MKNILLNYSHRIFPSKAQATMLSQQMFIENQVYNIVLQLLQTQAKEFSANKKHFQNMNQFFGTNLSIPSFKNISDSEIDRKVNSILKSRELFGELDTRQQARNIAKRAFWDGFRGKGFASFHRYDSNQGAFSWVNARVKLNETHVRFSKRIGEIKVKRERLFPDNSKIKTVRIKKKNNKFYVIFGIELDKSIKILTDFSKSSKLLGMDTNNGHVDFSNGESLKYRRSFTENELKIKSKKGKGKKTSHQKRLTKLLNEFSNIRKIQIKQSKRIEKSKKFKIKLGSNYKKDRLKLSKLQEKHANRRKNSLDKTSNEILSKEFSILFIENLAVKKMTSKNNKSNGMGDSKQKSMRKNILNFSYGELHSKLEYKAMLMDRLVISVDPAYTSQDCSSCGKRQKMPLSARVYECDCGLKLDRDINSAKNIEAKGQKYFFEELNPSSLAA